MFYDLKWTLLILLLYNVNIGEWRYRSISDLIVLFRMKETAGGKRNRIYQRNIITVRRGGGGEGSERRARADIIILVTYCLTVTQLRRYSIVARVTRSKYKIGIGFFIPTIIWYRETVYLQTFYKRGRGSKLTQPSSPPPLTKKSSDLD